jgi:F-type H+-transporting ATPase subunit delta
MGEVIVARATTTARRYAEAAFELARRDKAVDEWAEGLELASQLVADERIRAFLSSPAAPLAERHALLDRMLKGRAPDSVLKLAKLLAGRRAVDRLPAISAEYRRLVNRDRGVVEALVTSAAPLTTDETEALRTKVGKMTDRTVDLRVQVDDALIGGLTVRIGDTLYDASVRGRLERLREQLLSGAR